MPQETNRITAHASEKDQFGMPVPNVHFDDHPNDIAMREHAFGQGRAIYEAAGATHNLGTCRMSARASDGVVNKNGQAHDIDNLFISDGSQFTTGAAENPTLTIVTLAIRQADYIARQMSMKAI
jgi:choline dehydrogenase-like flavoprotein